MNAATLKQPNPNSTFFPFRRHLTLLAFLFLVACAVAACGWGSSGSAAADESAPIRTPHPTFTPTAQNGVAVQSTQLSSATAPLTDTLNPPLTGTGNTSVSSTLTQTKPEAATSATTQAVKTPAKAIVNTPLVNMRSGPSTDFSVVAIVDRGYEMDIVGKNAKGDWWKVCCVEKKSGWVDTELVDTEGAVDAVPVVKQDTAKADAPTATTAPIQPTPEAATSIPPAVTLTTTTTVTNNTASSDFDLIVKEQFPETKLVRLFLYVYNHDNTALEGYSLLVTKDGAPVPVKDASSAGRPGFTWPVADVRQRFQNMKVEFPGVAPAGVWTVQLSKAGKPVGPPATFTLASNEPNQELYVRYERR